MAENKDKYYKILSESYNTYIKSKIVTEEKKIVKDFLHLNEYKKIESELAQQLGLGDIVIINKVKEKIEEFCKENNVSKGWVAEKLHITKQALSDYFKSPNPKLDTLVKISILINCNLLDLFDYEVDYTIHE